MDEIDGDIPCSSLAVDSIIRVGTAGAFWGMCSGPYDATKLGLTGRARASFVAKSVGKFGLQCGFFAGIFLLPAAEFKDFEARMTGLAVNASVAGAIAGAAVAVRTRSWKQVIGMAALLSTVGAAADFSRTI